MLGKTEKILCCIVALASLFIFSNCSKEKEKTSLPVRSANQHTLIYTAGANGSIDGISPQTVNQGGSGSPVKAVPHEGYHFEGWSDGVATPERTDSDVTADLAVTAAFSINQYTLNYMATEGGAIEGESKQTVKHGADGSPVNAVAAEHYHFEGWSDGVETAQRFDRNITADHEWKAKFAIDQYTLSYTAKEHGSIKGVTPQTVDYGGDGTQVTAVPAEGYHFIGWSDGVTTADRTDRKVTGNQS
ncbi:MAG: InlB B-repeat-containing protein, partial [Deltaproteobacteria bacterium]